MGTLNIVLLPGLDGTGKLFARFQQCAPADFAPRAAAFPTDRPLDYDALTDLICPTLPRERVVLLGESFSGPLALRLAARMRPLAVVLCASFVRPSLPMRLSASPVAALLPSRPPLSVTKRLMSGGDELLASELIAALDEVSPAVIAARIRLVLGVDITSDLEQCACPVLYLRATEDRLVSARQADLARECLPDLKVVDVSGPHLLLQSAPKECWRAIAGFVRLK